MGIRGWAFEQFGADVFILRASASAPSGQASNPGIFISCSGSDRRLRLSLPASIAQRETLGYAAITTSERPNTTATAIVRFTSRNPFEIMVSEKSGLKRDIAVAIGQMLLTKPRALDIIVSTGTIPVTLTQLKAYRLFLSLGSSDIDAVKGFIQSCGRPSIQ